MSSRRLSIIIPALNESAVLPRTLQRLQSLRARGHEVILVDGRSDDSTGKIAQPLVDRVLDTRCGRAHQMNQGASKAVGEVFVFLHADTWLPDSCDTIIFDALGDKPIGWGRFDVELSQSGWLLRTVAFAMNVRSRLTGIATGDQAIFVHRSLFARVGGFAEIPLMEDVALSRCLKRISAPICLRDRVITSSRRWVSHGVIKTIFTMWWLRTRFALGEDPVHLDRIYTR